MDNLLKFIYLFSLSFGIIHISRAAIANTWEAYITAFLVYAGAIGYIALRTSRSDNVFP